MPWGTFKLNDGNEIPAIGWGSGNSGQGPSAVHEVKQALSLNFNHIDTAKYYQNEEEVGKAIKESRVPRKNLFITTKYSHLNDADADVQTAFKHSLNSLGVSYVDLYLIHRFWASSDVPALWRHFEEYKRKGWTRSIGVSHFDVPQLKILLASAKIKPAVNQIILHPYVYIGQKPVLDFCKANGILIEAYSALIPITHMAGGPLDKPLARISQSRRAVPEQILLAWVKAKGAVAVTTSSKRERLEGYLTAGDIELTDSEVAIIDAAGKEGNVDPPPDFQ